MSVFEIISSLSFGSTIIPAILATLFDVITQKLSSSKTELNINDFLDCIESTQVEFAKKYNEKYTANTQILISHVLNILADSQKDEFDLDRIAAGLIESSFGAEPTVQMINEWKQCFVKNINSDRYSNLKIALTSVGEDPGESSIQREIFHNITQ